MKDKLTGLFRFFSKKNDIKKTKALQVDIHDQFYSHYLKRVVRFDIYRPPVYDQGRYKSFPLLILNDGQDMESIKLKETLQNLYAHKLIRPILVVAIHAGYRMQEYGVAQQADYKNRGSLAGQYTGFVLQELLPFLKRDYKPTAEKAIAGFSLGGLSAFDIAWNHPDVFSKVGVFSGSFWWRSEPFNELRPDTGRIVLNMIKKTPQVPNLKFWFQTGTLDEHDDRNHNGLIDSIDDTVDVIFELIHTGFNQEEDIEYVELIGGKHDLPTWSRIMPDFLLWAFGYGKKYTISKSDVLIQTRRLKV